MMQHGKPVERVNKRCSPGQPTLVRGESLMKSISRFCLVALVLVGVSVAKELPNAPSAVARPNSFIDQSPTVASAPQLASEPKTVSPTFVGLALISTGSTFADSYTTLFARENWLARKKGVCNIEVQSAYLYGTHPTVGRTYAVASAKSVGSIFAAYYLRKHHSKFWSLPLIANTAISLQGVTQNMATCN